MHRNETQIGKLVYMETVQWKIYILPHTHICACLYSSKHFVRLREDHESTKWRKCSS